MQAQYTLEHKNRDKDFLFSVIIPVYNAEKYVEETINSLLNQTIGFENIEVILVDDGSTDTSAQICRNLHENYPENVTFISKNNGGASSARNAGMEHIHGKYVNFLDADDKWSEDAFRLADEFFAKNPDIDLTACRYCYFERMEGFSHPLDYKFKESTVVDINQKPEFVQLSAPTSFIKKDVLKDIRFDEHLTVSEDTVVVTDVIFKKCKYGLLKEAVYYYRKHNDEDSAIDTSRNNLSWYFDTPKYCYFKLFEMSREKFGEVIPYIQNLVMYDLQWRIKRHTPEGLLSEAEMNEYREIIRKLLKEIDDGIIMNQKSMFFAQQFYALDLKHGEKVISRAEKEGNALYYKGTKLFELKSKSKIKLRNISIHNNMLTVNGKTHFGVIEDRYELVLTDGQRRAEGGLFHEPERDRIAFDGNQIFSARGFKYDIPIHDGSILYFELLCPDGDKIRQYVRADKVETESGKYSVIFEKESIVLKKKSLLSRLTGR